MKETRRQRKRRRALSTRFAELTTLIIRGEENRNRRIQRSLLGYLRTFNRGYVSVDETVHEFVPTRREGHCLPEM